MASHFVHFDLDVKTENVFYKKLLKVPVHDGHTFRSGKVPFSQILEDEKFEPNTVGSASGKEVLTSIRRSSFLTTKINFNTDIEPIIREEALKIVPTSLKPAFIYPVNEFSWREPEYYVMVYHEGDFFVKHRDSKRKTDLATVLMFPPAVDAFSHTGGALKIYQPDGEVFTFESSENKDKFKVIIFDQQLEHEVEKITSGNRVVIKFSLSYDEKMFDLCNIPFNLDDLDSILPVDEKTETEKKKEVLEEITKILDEYWDEGGEEISSRISFKVKQMVQEKKEINFRYVLNHVDRLINEKKKSTMVVLTNFYQEPSPRFFYNEDLELLKKLKTITSKIKIVNTDFEVFLGTNMYEDASDKVDEEDIKFKNGSSSLPRELESSAFWLSCENLSGKVNSTYSEYNDEGYEVSQHRSVTCIILEP